MPSFTQNQKNKQSNIFMIDEDTLSINQNVVNRFIKKTAGCPFCAGSGCRFC